jgi:O-antigen chain-terminating methyltransferase
VAEETPHPALQELRRRLEDEEAAYAEALGALDRRATFPVPEETGPEVRELLEELNGLWPSLPRPEGRGLGAAFDRRAFDALVPVIERQARFNAVLVRFLNAHLEHEAGHHAREREMREALVRYAQRVEPIVDARDDMRVARTPTEAEQVLDAFGRRLDGMGRRLEGLLAIRDRVEALSEEVRAVRAALEGAAPAPEAARSAARAAGHALYTAFENRFRGSREEVRGRQADYVELLRGHAPVVDLGCGRGELLELLRTAGIAARGVEGSASAVQECRAKGLDVTHGELVEFLQQQPPGATGAVFAAQVAEHLEPRQLVALLAAAHRALAKDGLLVLETVNVASAFAWFDVFIRDLSHERPLHPETLRFMAAAAGFSEARIELRSPVPDDVRLHLLPGGGMPPPVVKVMNENVERLNALLFAPLDYALVATR